MVTQDVLTDRIMDVLKKQVELVRQGRFEQLEHALTEMDPMIKEWAHANKDQRADPESRHDHIRALYHELHMALLAQKDATQKQLNKVRGIRKTIATYHSSTRG